MQYIEEQKQQKSVVLGGFIGAEKIGLMLLLIPRTDVFLHAFGMNHRFI